ncbi:hypothetical protein DVA81_19295, partial [Acinetobacter baumannii]
MVTVVTASAVKATGVSVYSAAKQTQIALIKKSVNKNRNYDLISCCTQSASFSRHQQDAVK